MILLNAEHITRSFTEKPLLKDISLGIYEGDKIGLIGVNGTGKTTLLKILAGQEDAERGTITLTTGTRIGYLPQVPMFTKDATVLEQVLSNLPEEERDLREYEAKAILNRLGLPEEEWAQPVSLLSGGQRKRVALAGVLVNPMELLILDEPTNHLDTDMTDWLEQYLTKFNGAILMVTHDRYFLDRVTNKIAEVADHSLYLYEGNYSYYLKESMAREERNQAAQRKINALYQKELEWISRGARARTTKAKFRVERFEDLKNARARLNGGSLEVQTHHARLGKKIISLHHISKSYTDQMPDGSTRVKKLLDDFDLSVLRDDRIGIVGPNGAGKSTLLKIILGLVQPDSGHVEIGKTVRIGYFSQENEEMDLSLRMIDYIQTIAFQCKTPDGTLSASQMLERFLFPSNTHSTVIGRLSGGERRRLFLLGILMSAPNVMLLDEPTNDLDIKTLAILEDYLDGFPGAVLAISHDRYFLDRATRTRVQLVPVQSVPGSECTIAPAAPATPRQTRLKFSYLEQREFDTIDDEIATLEQQIKDLDAQMIRDASDHTLLLKHAAEKEKV